MHIDVSTRSNLLRERLREENHDKRNKLCFKKFSIDILHC